MIISLYYIFTRSIIYIVLLYLFQHSEMSDDNANLQTLIQKFIDKAKELDKNLNVQDFYQLVKELNLILQSIETSKLNLPTLTLLFDSTMLQVVYNITDKRYQNKEKSDSICNFILLVLKQLTLIFGANRQYNLAIKIIRAIMTNRNYIMLKAKSPSPFTFNMGLPSQMERLPTEFYQFCIGLIKEELNKYQKEVWSMSLDELINLIELFNSLQIKQYKNTYLDILYSSYFAQINALLQSGREQLLQFADQEKLTKLCGCFSKNQQQSVMPQQLQQLIPVFSKTLLMMGSKESRLNGIRLLNSQFKMTYFRTFKTKVEKLNDWIKNNDIYTLILSQQFSEEEFEQGNLIFKYFRGNFEDYQDQAKYLFNMLQKNNSQNTCISKFCLKELDVSSLRWETKEELIQFFENVSDLEANYQLYLETLQNVNQQYGISESAKLKCFNLTEKIVRKIYPTLNGYHQKQLFATFKKSTGTLRKYLQNLSKSQIVSYLKSYAKKLLEVLSHISLKIFNVVFQECDISYYCGHSLFQSIINYIIQEAKMVDKIFLFLEQIKPSQQQIAQVSNALNFISETNSSNINVTKQYLRAMVKFPELYQTLISNESYVKIKGQMQSVIQLFKSQPQTAFNILKTTFLMVNKGKFSEYSKNISLLNNRDQQPSLRQTPEQLQFYQQLISLFEQTESDKFRKEIAEFFVCLYHNYASYEYNKDQNALSMYGNHVINYFLQNVRSFRKNMGSKKAILANIELINKMIELTDILGVGPYKPHNSLVSTSTISLTILNNAKFGDDVQKSIVRNFPSNMVLFDMLTIVGLAFKCGPEELVLKQGQRHFPILLNGKILQDLNFTNEQIIAQKNEINYAFLKAPPLFENDNFTDIYVKCLTEVFYRYAFEGKMSLIECTNFVTQYSGSFNGSNERRVQEMFQTSDLDKDGILTLNDFLSYHKSSVAGRMHFTSKDQLLRGLQNFKYRKNMVLYSDPLDISFRYDEMMRAKLTKEDQVYKELFIFSECQDQQLSIKARQMLLNLPTCSAMKSLAYQHLGLNTQSGFLLYYKLILLENDLNKKNENQLSEQEKKQKEDKISLFIKGNYNQLIFNLLGYYYERLNENKYSYQCFMICLKILRNLINIENLADTDINKLQFNSQAIHTLPQTTFFSNQALKALQKHNVINFEVLLVLQLTQDNINLDPIIEGCFSNDQQIRKICCSFLYLWQEKNNWKDNLFYVKIVQSNCIEWFSLLCVIINRANILNLAEILQKTVKDLSQRQQSLYNRYDKVIFGYLNIIKAILFKQNKLVDAETLQTIISGLLQKTISEKNRALLYDIMIELNEIQALSYFQSRLSTILPSQQCQIRSKYVGLRNLGATCYINSIVQQFFMTEKFRYLILNRNIENSYKQVEVNGKTIIDDFNYQFQKMYYHLHKSQKKYYLPNQFCFSYKDFDGVPINTSIQGDAHEFLNKLVENVENACKLDKKTQQLQRLLQIKTMTEFECGDCKNRIIKIENHYSCMLEVKEQSSLDGSLRKFISSQKISDYFCQNCQKKVNTFNKRTYLHQLPEIVILNMQRIIYDPHQGNKVKVHTKLIFPNEIDFEQFIKNENAKNMETKYRLKGVVIHTGTSEGGHYYSLIKDNNSQGWLKFNDQNVIDFDEKEIQREGFGGFEIIDGSAESNYSTNAYILFYQKIGIGKIQCLELQNILSHDVHLQNVKLIQEVKIHQQCFFAAIQKLYKKYRLPMMDQKINQQRFSKHVLSERQRQFYIKLLQIHLKANSFLSVFSGVKPEIRNRLSLNILQLYHILPELSTKFFTELNMDTFVLNLISHGDSSYRLNLKDIFMKNFLAYISYNNIILGMQSQQYNLLQNKINVLFSYIDNPILFNNLNKSINYFTLIDCIIHFERYWLPYLMQKNLMFKLLDLIMGRQSTYMKYHPDAQDLPNHLIPAIYPILYKIIDFKMYQDQLSLNNKSKQTASIDPSNKIIFSSAFYRRIYKFSYDHQLLTPFFCYYSKDNLDYTLLITDVLLYQLNKNDMNKNTKLLLNHIDALVNIEDELAEIRFAGFFGIHQYIQNRSGSFCLDRNEKSDYVHYITANYPNKQEPFDFDSERKPLLQFLVENKYNNQDIVLNCMLIMLKISESSEKAFHYLLKILPPNYLKHHIFDQFPSIIKRLRQNQNFIIQNKMDLLAIVSNLYEIIRDRISGIVLKLPLQKYIIGKNIKIMPLDKIDEMGYYFELCRYETYVLENIPTGNENKSLDKDQFGWNIRGKANLFVIYGSRPNFQPQEAIETRLTVYTLKGKTNRKLKITFLDDLFNYTIFISDQSITINFPYAKEGMLKDLIKIEPYKEPLYEINFQQLASLFPLSFELQKIKEEEKAKQSSVMITQNKLEMDEGKIECPTCTYLNNIYLEKCVMCENLLLY